MLKRTTSCYVLVGFSRVNSSRRDGTEEGKGEMEETTEKNRQIAGNLLGGKKDEEGERPYIYFFSTISIFHQKWKFSVSICMGCTDFLSDKQLFDSACRWDVFALSQKLHPGCHTSKYRRYVSKPLHGAVHPHGSEKVWTDFVSAS